MKKYFVALGIILTILITIPAHASTINISDGDLVKVAGSPAVYYIQDNMKRVFPHANVFSSWGYSGYSGIKTVTAVELATYADGDPMPFRDGSLFRGTSTGLSGYAKEAVYYVQDGKIRPVQSSVVYQTLFKDPKWIKVTWVPDDMLDKFNYSAGDMVTSSATHPDGTLIKYSDSNTKYLISDGTKRAFASDAIFKNNRYLANNVITVDNSEVYPDGSPIAEVETALLRPTPSVIILIINNQPSTCTSWTYSDWSVCSSGGTQTRVAFSSLPLNCTGGAPTLSQSCVYTPPQQQNTCTFWTYSPWSTCSSGGAQTRVILGLFPAGCTGGAPLLSQECSTKDQVESLVKPATVYIITPVATGSGVIIESNGYILTNKHVVGTYDNVQVKIPGRSETFNAVVIGRRSAPDLALIKINTEGLPTINQGDSSQVKEGDSVTALGYALGVYNINVTTGNIGSSNYVFDAVSYIAHSAQIYPGNSGGPLVDRFGKLIGINTSIPTQGQYFANAIPINTAKILIPAWKANPEISSPICTFWTYSSWSTCSVNNAQTRTVTSFSPSGCSGGSPILTQSCVYSPPAAGTLTMSQDAGTPNAGIVVAGTNIVVLSKIKFAAATEAFTVNKFQVQMATSTYDSSISSVTISPEGGTPQTKSLTSGVANFTNIGWVVPADTSKVVTITANLSTILAANNTTGRDLKIGIDGADTNTFEAVGASQTVLTASTDASIKYGNSMFVRKTKPTVSLVTLSSSTLANGTLDLYKFNVAADAANDLALKKFKFDITLSDTATTTALTATSWQLYDAADMGTALSVGWSDLTTTSTYATTAAAVPLVNGSSTLIAALTTEKVIPAGSSKTFVLVGVVSASAQYDSIITRLGISNDTVNYMAGLAADANSTLWKLADASASYTTDFLWSDNSSGVNHTYAAGTTYKDWVSGYLVQTVPTSYQTLSR